MKSTSPKIIFFDLDSTLTEPNVNGWDYVIRRASAAAGFEFDFSINDKWFNGIYHDYREWIEETVRPLKEHGVTRDMMEQSCCDIAQYVRQDVPLMLSELKLAFPGVRTVILTGSLDCFATSIKRALEEMCLPLGCPNPIDEVLVCPCLYDDNGVISGVDHIFVEKSEIIAPYCSKFNIDPLTEAIHVGDGSNDLSAFYMVAGGVAVPGACRVLRKYASQDIECRPGESYGRAVWRGINEIIRQMEDGTFKRVEGIPKQASKEDRKD